ncbi:hypothetical protein [Mycolicibacterium porcinum]|uniref:4Fe-4S Wbl-type domain-containing protein n=1 Tax=Mycolicibacterium porcinum TaxID=39693 RepID=A0ABV3VP62_9MYCO
MTMTMCATSPQEQPTTSLGARFDLNHKLSDSARRALFTLNDQLIEYGPTDCQINVDEFTQIEETTAHLIKIRLNPNASYIAIDGKAVPVREPLKKVLKWCDDCPVRAACLAAMGQIKYTGIAGGQILKKGEPWDYAKSRSKKNQEDESEIPDGLW